MQIAGVGREEQRVGRIAWSSGRPTDLRWLVANQKGETMDLLGALSALAPKFVVSTLPSDPPLRPTLRIAPPPEALGPDGNLLFSQTVETVTQVKLPVDVDLAFVGKWVRSLNADPQQDPAAEDPIGGMPVVNQVALGPALTTNLPPATQMFSDAGKAAEAGVPEVLGRVKGTVTQTVEKITSTVRRLPIKLALRWTVTDQSGSGVSVRYRTTAAGWSALPARIDLPPNGVPAPGTARTVQLDFPITFTELTTTIPQVMRFNVQPSVRLSVQPDPALPATVTTGFIDLPAVPLVIPTVPVPTMLVLCEHRDFAGRKLVLVPSNSPLAAASGASLSVGSALQMTQTAVTSLLPTNALITFLAASTGSPDAIAAANTLKSLAAATGQTIIAGQPVVDDLGTPPQFVFEPGGFLGVGRFTGDRMASSIICIGRIGTVFEMFRSLNRIEDITRLQITLNESLGCAVQSLFPDPTNVYVVYGGVVTMRSPRTYNDQIRSLQIISPPEIFQAPLPPSP
jgi:hypothetical protein